MNNNRTLIPRSYFGDMKGWGIEFAERENLIIKRWNLPAAQLYMPANYITKFSSVNLANDELDIKSVCQEDEITFTVTSAIRYYTTNGFSIYLTTCLLSEKAASINYRLIGDKLNLRDGTQAAIFKMLQPQHTPLNITYITESHGRKYQVTIDADIKVVKATSPKGGSIAVASMNQDGGDENIVDEDCIKDLASAALFDGKMINEILDSAYIFDARTNLSIEKFLDIVKHNLIFQ